MMCNVHHTCLLNSIFPVYEIYRIYAYYGDMYMDTLNEDGDYALCAHMLMIGSRMFMLHD